LSCVSLIETQLLDSLTPISILMLVTPLPVFSLLLGFELGEVVFRVMLRFQPLLVGAVFTVIPLVIVIAIFIVVSPGLVFSGLKRLRHNRNRRYQDSA
jgi:hypothetical protein